MASPSSFESPASTKTAVDIGDNSSRFDILFFKRLCRISGVLLRGVPILLTIFLLVILLVLAISQAFVRNLRAVLVGKAYVYFAAADWPAVWSLIGEMFLYSLVDAFCSFVLVDGFIQRVGMAWVWRGVLTRELLKRYFKGKTYYYVLQGLALSGKSTESKNGSNGGCYRCCRKPRGRETSESLDASSSSRRLRGGVLDNPDQRIASDAKDFCDNLSKVVVSGVTQLVAVITGTIVLIQNAAYWMLIPVFLWPVLNSIAYPLLFGPVAKAVFEKDRLEGHFRRIHARTREHAESMAFFSSGQAEKEKADIVFKQLKRAILLLACRFAILNTWNQIADQLPMASYLGTILILVFLKVKPLDASSPTQISNVVNAFYTLAINAGVACASFFAISKNLSVVIGNTARIGQLLEAFDETESQIRGDSHSGPAKSEEGVADGPEDWSPESESLLASEESEWMGDSRQEISLDNVTIQTPSGDILTEGLSFRVQSGDSLIIMGPSGVGKSSILRFTEFDRVIAGLWQPSVGSVARPSKIGANGIFFLPQKPYLVDGSLRANIVYPLSEKEVCCSDAKLQRVMEMANISYLLSRASLHKNDVSWPEKLSLGESQRLAAARLFFHRPRFAVLDECTSALDPENELNVYDHCRSLGITMISVAHRVSCMQFHQRVLYFRGRHLPIEIKNIRDVEIPKFDYTWRTLAKFEPTFSVEEVEFPEKLTELDDKDVGMAGANCRSLARLARFLFCGTLIRGCGMWCLVLLGIVAAIAIPCATTPLVSLGGVMIAAISTRNLKNTIITCGSFVALLLVLALVTAMGLFLTSVVGVCMRSNLLDRLQEPYFRNKTFYRLNVLDKSVDNVDQRMTQDVDLLTSGFETTPGLPFVFFSLIQSIVSLIVIFVLSMVSVGPAAAIASSLIFLVCFIFEIILIGITAKVRFLQQKKEGFFRTSLARLVEYSEQIAFFDGKIREQEVIQTRLSRLLRNQLTLSVLLVIENGLTQALLAFAYPLTYLLVAMTWQFITPNALGRLPKTTVIAYISNEMSYFVNALFGVSTILLSLSWMGGVFGNLGRCGQLLEKFSGVELNSQESLDDHRDEGSDLTVSNLTGVTPLGKILFRRLSLELLPGCKMLIVGRSGCGKSSLLRIIAGLWETRSRYASALLSTDSRTEPEGSICCPQRIGSGGLFFLPQRPYLVPGSLKQQVTYPHPSESISDAKFRTLFSRVNLSYLLKDDSKAVLQSTDSSMDFLGSPSAGVDVDVAAAAEDPLLLSKNWTPDAIEDWSVVLSPGEQQRVSFARLLNHQPKIAILDESTSALDLENEELVYTLLTDPIALRNRYFEAEDQDQMSLLSVGHRRSLLGHHTHLLSLEDDGGWRLSKKVENIEDIVSL